MGDGDSGDELFFVHAATWCVMSKILRVEFFQRVIPTNH
ncbi:hypothetical protein DES37_101226 [Mangrovibacter plantisponsor]|uniref:Uncharacterized protein n=1 Tax=Mangrovibacter plantisponsor TaxID=451513 RepID=A0A317Q6N4_9ENTR|nr:hypothetical protein DES37_101226 [Mangrovibacter plantisponsor]